MAGVYYGAVFGGSTSSILINAPGIPGTVAPSFDGYPVPGGYKTSSFRELIQVLEYVKNQIYIYHTDCSPKPESFEYHRKISIIRFRC